MLPFNPSDLKLLLVGDLDGHYYSVLDKKVNASGETNHKSIFIKSPCNMLLKINIYLVV
jgi:hypothetical protein